MAAEPLSPEISAMLGRILVEAVISYRLKNNLPLPNEAAIIPDIGDIHAEHLTKQ